MLQNCESSNLSTFTIVLQLKEGLYLSVPLGSPNIALNAVVKSLDKGQEVCGYHGTVVHKP